MSGGLNWALEKMGWRVPEEDDYEVQMDAEIHEYPFPPTQSVKEEEVPAMARRAHTTSSDVEFATADTERRRIVTVHPRSFSDALSVGEAFRNGLPVIMNLTDMDDSEARRIIDFAAGLTFGLQGEIERVTTRVFLLSPADTVVTTSRGASYR